MIKKNFKYLLLFVIGFMILTSNVKAATQPCEKGEGNGLTCYQDDKKQYHFTYNKKELFCVSKSLGSPSNIASDCSVEEVEFITSQKFEQADYITKRNALRAALKSKGYYKGTSLSSTDTLGISVNYKAKVKISQGAISYNGDTATVDIITKSDIDSYTLTTDKGHFEGGGSSIELSKNATVKLVVQSPKLLSSECDAIKVKITASYEKSKDIPSAEFSGTTWYHVTCGGGKQDFMFEGSAGIPWSDKYTGETWHKPLSVQKEISIMPNNDECTCKGSSDSFCVECAKDATASDTTKNLLNCANNNAFESYCGTKGDIRKPEMISNPYCDVYCTEEISYSLPGEITTQAGRYFKLMREWSIKNVVNGKDENKGEPITMKGTRTCFTSEVNRKKYVEDVKEIEEAVIEKYNNYLYYTNGIEALKNATTTANQCSTGWVEEEQVVNNVKKKVSVCKGCTYTLHTAKKDYNKKKGNYDDDTGAFKGTSDVAASYTDTWYTGTSGSCDAYAKNKPTFDENQLKQKAQAELDGGKEIQKDIKNIVKTYKKCTDGTGWKNNYCFKPAAEFSYKEPYNDIMKGDLPVDYGSGASAEGFQASTSLSDRSHYTLGTPASHNDTNTNYVNIKGTNIEKEPYKINPMIQYAKQISRGTAKFGTATHNVVTYKPYGTVAVKDSCAGESNCEDLGYSFPVALQRPTTLDGNNKPVIGDYTITFKNVGTSGDDSCTDETLGRVSDPDCSLSARENGNCPTDYSCKPKLEPPSTCDKCEVSCECPPNEPDCEVIDKVCIWKDRECPECEISCDTCIWDNGDTTIAYKPISLTKVFKESNSTGNAKTGSERIGSNWETPQGQAAIAHIETWKEAIYDTTYTETDEGKKSYYLIEITPAVGARIRAYNAKSAGYADDSLNCVNNFCESYFLRNFLTKEKAVKKAPFITR